MPDMHTEFRRAEPMRELRRLMAFDRILFRPADRFPGSYWKQIECYWLLVGGERAGCCAFERDVDINEDMDGENVRMPGSLYIATTGIHPRFRSLGFGRLMKAWQICYARRMGFSRIVTNMRAGNAAMIALNREFGFQRLRTIRRYYEDPVEATIVMERSVR